MKAPKRIRIGVAVVKVELVTKLTEDDKEVHGTFGDGIIQLHDTLSGKALAETFLHELLHAITYYYHIAQPEFNEEQVVARYSFPLTTFFMDNPTARRWWCSLLR
jgi:hypothetical protein